MATAADVLRGLETHRLPVTDGLKKELGTVRTGRASPELVEHIRVDYSGTLTPLRQMAGISTPAANMLVIQPWDPGTLGLIEKAILKSDVGLTPSNDGKVIRLTLPPLSEERRRDLVKLVKQRVEERKVAIRNLRRDAIEKLKAMEKNKEISQDDSRRGQEQVQKTTDSFIAAADKIGLDKEAELMKT